MWNDSVWDLVDQAVDRLALAYRASAPVELADYLPQADGATRRIVLTHLIQIDLEHRWERGERIHIENYLPQWPELSDDDDALADLLAAECRVRLSHGQAVTRQELQQRFPSVAMRVELPERESRRAADEEPIADAEASSSLGRSRAGTQPAAAGAPLLLSGHRLGRYEIQRVLGRGGMGTVYLAQDRELERLVAIKIWHTPGIFSEQSASLIQAEAKTIAKLNHPGIVSVFDAGREPDGTCFFVMEYVEGQSLAERLASQPIDAQQAAEICLQVVEALDGAHSRGIIHCDIKPGNILIDLQHRARVTDFGLAIHRETCSETAKRLCGTLPYMSPEQVRGEIGKLDGRTDIWSLGVVLYELLTGQRPFRADSLDGWSEAIRQHHPLPPRRICRKVSQELEWICLECLQKEPSRRYATTAELAVDLRQAAQPPRRRWWKIAAVALVFLMLIGPIDYLAHCFLNHPTLDYAASSDGGWLATHSCYYGTGWYGFSDLPQELDQLLNEIHAGGGTIIGAGIGRADQWIVIFDRDGKRQVRASNAPQALTEAIARIESQGKIVQDVALSGSGNWALVYRSGVHTVSEYSETLPSEARELLQQLTASGAWIGGIGLFENDGWVVFYKDRFDDTWRGRYASLPPRGIQYLRENRHRIHLRHAAGTRLPWFPMSWGSIQRTGVADDADSSCRNKPNI
jgi:predicted Ser/Thr protein kinase